MPSHIRTAPAREIHHSALEILRLPPPPSRYPLTDTRKPIRIIKQRGVHLRRDIPRRDSIGRDTAGAPTIREALGELAHGALARRVGGDVEPALERQQGREVDHAAAAARRRRRLQPQHVRPHVPAQRERRVQVHLHDGVEVGRRERLGRVPDLDPRAVHQHPDRVPVR